MVFLERKPAKSLSDYRQQGGLKSLEKARALSAEAIVSELTAAGLFGRGGAGFPTGRKWGYALAAKAEPHGRVVVCNSAESEPGIEKDHFLGTEHPFLVLEGLLVACAALDAGEGYVLLKRNKPELEETYKKAIEELKQAGVLNGVELKVVVGSSHYLMGEESSIINLINGKPAVPYRRPPYPSESGVKGRPTVVNNAETLAHVPLVLESGGTDYAKRQAFLCTLRWEGKKRLVEVPVGSSMTKVASDAGIDLANVKAVLATPSGGFIPKRFFGEAITVDNYRMKGISFAGCFVFLPNSASIPRQTLALSKFFGKWSCRQCVECSKGIGVDSVAVLDRLCAGTATRGDYESLAGLCDATKTTMCGLAPSAARAIRTAVTFFPEEFESCLAGKPAGSECWSEGL